MTGHLCGSIFYKELLGKQPNVKIKSVIAY
nr:unnamed protein product [Callosobruchus analis]